MDYAEAGDNIGCLLRGIDVILWSAAVWLHPAASSPHKFKAESCIEEEEGGGTPFSMKSAVLPAYH